MESPKTGCDLGTCVAKRRSKNTLRSCLAFFYRGFPRGQGLCLGPSCKKMAYCVCVVKPTKAQAVKKGTNLMREIARQHAFPLRKSLAVLSFSCFVENSNCMLREATI